MRAHLLAAALCAGLLTVGRAAPARAQGDSVLVRVGGELAGRQGETIEVPITVDLSGAPGRALGSYRATLRFNPALLEFQGVGGGSFAAPQINTNHAADSGAVLLAAVQPSGASGAVVLFYARFYVVSDTAQSPVTISFDEMSATATSVTPFESLVPLLRIVNGTFCKSLGRWGDVNGDGDANSLDALVALSTVVGIPVDTRVMTPALADVDGDGKVTSRDALIILSYAVGLPVQGYRVLLNAPGACGTGTPITIVASPDSVELQVGQTTAISFQVQDSLGRSVSTDTGTVTSSDPSVAGWMNTEGVSVVQARAPGVAIFTARLGPGVATTFKVVVLARRTTWYVDVEHARLAPTQLGNQALPMEFIGDALELAHDGDTVRVASGIYEEEVSGNVAVTILGDATDRPVIDPRGAPDWRSYYRALDLEANTGLLVAANLVVRAGMVYLSGHDITVRNVTVSMLGGSGNAALELVSGAVAGDAPPARVPGPERANAPAVAGSVLVDGVAVSADSTSNGILVDLADTAVIRNSTVARTTPGNSSCDPGPYTSGGIVVRQASVSAVHNNVVTNGNCQGIGVFDYQSAFVAGGVGRATVSQNRVTGASATGIAAGARLVALDHNAVRNTGAGTRNTYGATAGIHVIQSGPAPDSVTSLGDTVSNSGGRGFALDTAGAATIDSLVIAGTGQDGSSYGGFGVDLEHGGRFVLSHSHISNTYGDNGVNVQGDHSVLQTHGNHISGSGYNGISLWYYYRGGCDGECAPVARSGPERIGSYTGGPDSLISVSDTVLDASDDGIYVEEGVYALVDSLVVDSTGYDGVEAYDLGRLVVQNSSIRRTSDAAIDPYYVDHVESLRNRLVNNFGNGLYLEGAVDTVRIYGNVVDNTGPGWSGLWILGSGVNVLVDSSQITNSGNDGIQFEAGSGGRVRRSRIEASQRYGISVLCCGYDSVVVRQSTIEGNIAAGAANQNIESSAMLDADTNYWGDPNGPTCRVEGPCSGLGSGDSVLTSGVSFAGWLPGPPVTPAPPFRALAAAGAGARTLAAGFAGNPATHHVTVRHGSGAMRPSAVRAPSAVRSAATGIAGSGSAPQRSQHRQPAAWHAPSRAKTHAMQITVKRRT